ncbi:MAG: LysR family transcriptional regulator [Planctomycetes bacterium]|nr:LysR family transcriptional regulator [Planctomycetota bacterium]
MEPALLSVSTDQIAAFVELARQGSLRKAAGELFISEQGLRCRLLALEQRLGTALYLKQRGIRRGSLLTAEGRRILPHAIDFLDRARNLGELFAAAPRVREVHVAASQYLIYYVLIDAVKRFHARFPQIRIRLSSRTEQEIEAALLSDPDLALGIAAPYDPSADLEYVHLFSMDWSVIAPPGHPLLKRRRLTLERIAGEPLILFERGSTGRRHIVEGFQRAGASPRIEMEMTNTQVIVRMVEAGLGVSIVPLLPGGAVTRGVKVGVRRLGRQIEPIRSGILTRRGETPAPAASEFIAFVRKRAAARDG